MWQHVLTIDVEWFRQLNGVWIHPALDWLLSLVSTTRLMLWPLWILILCLALFGGFKGRVVVLLGLLCVGIGDPIIVNAIKHQMGRERPYEKMQSVRRVYWQDGGPQAEIVSQQPGTPYSMPSAHVANNTTIALVLMLVYGWRRMWWCSLWVLLMMYSRVYTGNHFPLDTLAGMILASCYTVIICCIANRVWQKYAPRIVPELYARYDSLY